MSATNHTTTIGLSQYISTDKPTYLSDYNGDMLAIDNAIAADRDSISTAQNKADTADGKADANKTSIDTLDAQINGDPTDPSDTGMAGKVNAIDGSVNTINALIGNGSPTTSDQTIIGAVNGLEASLAPREDGATLTASYAENEQFARGALLYTALTALTAGTAFNTLVLNTDYKLSPSIVEQMAGVKDNIVDGWLYEGEYTLDHVVDTTKTYNQNLNEMWSALIALIPTLADDERIVIIGFGISNQNFRSQVDIEFVNSTPATTFALNGYMFGIDRNSGLCQSWVASIAESNSALSVITFAVDSTVTVSVKTSDTPSSGTDFIKYAKYKRQY